MLHECSTSHWPLNLPGILNIRKRHLQTKQNKTTIIVNKSIINGITISKSSVRQKKNISLFTVTRPTLFSAATLVHFIVKSKVKVDTSEIFGLKTLFPVTSWKIIGINFFIILPQVGATIFLRYYNTFTTESNQIYFKVRYLFRIQIGLQSGISVCEIKWKNKIKWKSDLPTLFFWRM